jgi:hypothetical protein
MKISIIKYKAFQFFNIFISASQGKQTTPIISISRIVQQVLSGPSQTACRRGEIPKIQAEIASALPHLQKVIIIIIIIFVALKIQKNTCEYFLNSLS